MAQTLTVDDLSAMRLIYQFLELIDHVNQLLRLRPQQEATEGTGDD